MLAVALVASISLLGACDTKSSRESNALIDQRSAAANKAAAARHRLVIARRRAAAARRRATTTTTPRPVATPTTIVTQASFSPANDLAAIRRTFDALNSAFGAGVASGISNSAVANQWVGDVYSGNQCVSFEWARGQGVVSEMLVVHLNSLSSTPGWVDPVIGRVPPGRIYRMAIDEIQTNVATGRQRGRTLWIHMTVRSDGNARLFLRCH